MELGYFIRVKEESVERISTLEQTLKDMGKEPRFFEGIKTYHAILEDKDFERLSEQGYCIEREHEIRANYAPSEHSGPDQSP